jgi:hypothetical protein
VINIKRNADTIKHWIDVIKYSQDGGLDFVHLWPSENPLKPTELENIGKTPAVF